MIDLVLWAPDKATFRAFAIANGLLVPDGDGHKLRAGFECCWWAGAGKMLTRKAEYAAPPAARIEVTREPEYAGPPDARIEVTPAQYLNGVVALCRIYADFFASDKLDAGPEQHERSKLARHIKDNGTPGKMGGINYYELDGVRIFRPQDVTDFLAARNLPGHEWLGGVNY